MKSRSAARAGLIRREDKHGDFEDDDRGGRSGHNSTQRWARRLGLEEQRLYEMVRLRGQFLELLRESGLYNNNNNNTTNSSSSTGESKEKLGGSSHRKALHQAQHREHLKTKRRRVLTLQDNVSIFARL